jgi:hypothetical protein
VLCDKFNFEVDAMNEKFDIFKRLPDGNPLWVRAVEGLVEAKKQLAQIAEVAPGEYFLYESPTGKIIPFSLSKNCFAE